MTWVAEELAGHRVGGLRMNFRGAAGIGHDKGQRMPGYGGLGRRRRGGGPAWTLRPRCRQLYAPHARGQPLRLGKEPPR